MGDGMKKVVITIKGDGSLILEQNCSIVDAVGMIESARIQIRCDVIRAIDAMRRREQAAIKAAEEASASGDSK